MKLIDRNEDVKSCWLVVETPHLSGRFKNKRFTIRTCNVSYEDIKANLEKGCSMMIHAACCYLNPDDEKMSINVAILKASVVGYCIDFIDFIDENYKSKKLVDAHTKEVIWIENESAESSSEESEIVL